MAGNGYLISYDKEKPEYKSIFTGGKKIFNTPHGGTIDYRDAANPTVLIASRESNRLKWFTLEGKYIEEVILPGARPLDTEIVGDFLYVPSLSGFLSILDKDNKLISQPGGNWPEFDEKGNPIESHKADDTFINPHNILVDDKGDLYVPQWNSGKTYPVKLERINPFSAGNCCDKAFKKNKQCTHPCCLTAARAGQVCKSCNANVGRVTDKSSNALDFSIKRITGERVTLKDAYKGKVVLLVNVASQCGLTEVSRYRRCNELQRRRRGGARDTDLEDREPVVRHHVEAAFGRGIHRLRVVGGAATIGRIAGRHRAVAADPGHRQGVEADHAARRAPRPEQEGQDCQSKTNVHQGDARSPSMWRSAL